MRPALRRLRCFTERQMAERSFAAEVQQAAPGRRRGVPWRRHPGRHQGAAAVRRVVRRRLPGRADLAPDGRAHGRQRHPARTRRPLRAQRLGGHRGRHAGGIGQLPAARRGHLQVHGGHQRGLGRAGQPGLGRRHRRRADHRGRGLRRRLQHHAGALPRLRDEVADLAAGSAAQPAQHRARGGTGLRALRGQPHAGDAGAAHPRLPRARPLHRQGQPAPDVHPQGRDRAAAARHRAHRAAAGDLPARAGEDRRSAGRPRCASSRSAGSTSSSPRTRRTSASCCRAACTTACCARWNCWAWPMPSATRRCRCTSSTSPIRWWTRSSRASAPASAACWSSKRASPTSSSRPCTPSCARPTCRPGCTARTCCRWPASTPAACWSRASPRSCERYAAGLLDEPRVARRRAGRSRWPRWKATRRRSRSATPPRRCTGARLRSAPAAPSGRSSRPSSCWSARLGPHHVSCDIGCHLFSILPPFNIGATTMGYGLGWAGAAAFNTPETGKRTLSIMGDGGFWHNGLTSGVGNAVFNQTDNVLVVVDNGYSAATGGQDVLSSKARQPDPRHQPPDRAGGARRRREVGADRGPHLQPGADARRAARGADHAGEGPQGDRRVQRVHAEQAAPREAAGAQGDRRGPARGARALRRRPRHLHRRPFLHPPVGLPVADHQAQPRPAAPRPGGHGGRQLRGLRPVRRGRPCGRAVPVVLPGRDRQQPDALGPPAPAPGRAAGSSRIAPADRAGSHSAAESTRADLRKHDPPPRGMQGGTATHARSPSPCWPWAAKAAACCPTGWWTWPSTTASSRRPRRCRAWPSAPAPPCTTWSCSRPAGVPAGAQPVLALAPVPGELDVVIASELMEAGRALQRGLVTPDRTTFVASTHRVYSMAERTAMGDGRVDADKLLEGARAAARAPGLRGLLRTRRARGRADLGRAVRRPGGRRAPCRFRASSSKKRSAVAVSAWKAACAAFAAGFDAAQARATRRRCDRATPARRLGPRLALLEPRIADQFPLDARETLRHGRDAPGRLPGRGLRRRVPRSPAAAARHAARCCWRRRGTWRLWMTYEDAIRVADLKTRRTRFDRVGEEVRLRADPAAGRSTSSCIPASRRSPTSCPPGLGRWLLRSRLAARCSARSRARAAWCAPVRWAASCSCTPSRRCVRWRRAPCGSRSSTSASTPGSSEVAATRPRAPGAGARSRAGAAAGQGLRRHARARLAQLPEADGRLAPRWNSAGRRGDRLGQLAGGGARPTRAGRRWTACSRLA